MRGALNIFRGAAVLRRTDIDPGPSRVMVSDAEDPSLCGHTAVTFTQAEVRSSQVDGLTGVNVKLILKCKCDGVVGLKWFCLLWPCLGNINTNKSRTTLLSLVP